MIRFTKAAAKTKKKPKGGKKATLNKLKSFLTKAEPEAIEILVSNWGKQETSVTYKELREAYLAGGLTEKQFTKWQKDYANLVNTKLMPKFQQAADTAAAEVQAKYPYFVYEPQKSATQEYIKDQGAKLVTNLAVEQKQAVNAMIQHVSGYTMITPDEAARIIRPTIGLTKPQALANARYRQTVEDAYLKAHPRAKIETAKRKAADAAARYAARQHRYRAQNIARTELAYAYNAGSFGATKDAQEQGYIGDCVKVWLTAYDRRVCPECSELDGEQRNMDEPFSNGLLLPPAHPSCRCAVEYDEIDGTNLNPHKPQDTMDDEDDLDALTTPSHGKKPFQDPDDPLLDIDALDPASGIADPMAITPGVPQKQEYGYKVSEVVDDLSVLPKNQHGVAVRSDGTMVENLNMTGRRVTIGSSDYYEFSGKLTEESWEQAAKHAKQHGYSTQMDFLMRDAATGNYRAGDSGFQLDAYKIMTQDQGVFEIYSDYSGKQQYGMGGYFRVRVPATGDAAKDKKALTTVFDKAGLRGLTSDPTDADELLLKKTRLAWQRDPQAFEQARYLTGSAREQAIDKILAKSGIDTARVQSMTLTEVFPGYSTYLDEKAMMEYKKAGLTHVWAGVGDADSVVAICQSDGFAATNYRITSGMKKCGASPGQDMRTGGSDGVFTRIGVKTDMEYSYSFLGEEYRVIIDPDVLARTDWYAHRGDSYGVARIDDSRWKKRLGTTDFIKSQTGPKYSNNSFTTDNEILFRHGISKDKFVGISCENDRNRTALLDKFRAAGVTEFNGVPIDEFVTVTKKVGEDSIRGIRGLSYYDKDIPF